VIQTYGRHRGVEELPHEARRSTVGGSLIEHAVVEALLRASLEIHGALSLLNDGGIVAARLREALDCLDAAVNQTRREVVERMDDGVGS
jgi:hypothetical protein